MKNINFFNTSNEYYDNNIRPNLTYIKESSVVKVSNGFKRTAYFNIPEDVVNDVVLVHNNKNVKTYYLNGKQYQIDRTEKSYSLTQNELLLARIAELEAKNKQ